MFHGFFFTYALIHFSKNWNYNVEYLVFIIILTLWLGLIIYYSQKLSVWFFSKFNDFYKLRPENYNKNAREAFAKSLIDLSSALAKGAFYIVLLLPTTLILKGVLDKNSLNYDYIFNNLPWVFVILLGLIFSVSLMFRQVGLRHLHEMDEEKNESPK